MSLWNTKSKPRECARLFCKTFLLTIVVRCTTLPRMANLSNPNITVRVTDDDKKLLAKLRKKLGVEVSQIVRLGLRALATKEGVPV